MLLLHWQKVRDQWRGEEGWKSFSYNAGSLVLYEVHVTLCGNLESYWHTFSRASLSFLLRRFKRVFQCLESFHFDTGFASFLLFLMICGLCRGLDS